MHLHQRKIGSVIISSFSNWSWFEVNVIFGNHCKHTFLCASREKNKGKHFRSLNFWRMVSAVGFLILRIFKKGLERPICNWLVIIHLASKTVHVKWEHCVKLKGFIFSENDMSSSLQLLYCSVYDLIQSIAYNIKLLSICGQSHQWAYLPPKAVPLVQNFSNSP